VAPDAFAAGGVQTDLASWTDSHCHIQEHYRPEEDVVESLLARALQAGVTRLVCVGTDAATSRQAVELASLGAGGGWSGPQMWATVGVHPHEASGGIAPLEELLDSLVGSGVLQGEPKAGRPAGSVVAIGECGLDYHYDHAPRPVQRRVFEEQIRLAKAYGLSLVVHTRDAWDDTVGILAAAGPPEQTIIHCFTGGPKEAELLLGLGAYLSFSGIATFGSAGNVREAARCCPGDRLLVETDAPFLAPVPHRGRPNEPAFVTLVGASIAVLRGVDPAELAATSSKAATDAFLLG